MTRSRGLSTCSIRFCSRRLPAIIPSTSPAGRTAWSSSTPANAATAYTPSVITVTSGRSDGSVGTPDGLFDSGSIERPNTFRPNTFTVTFSEPGEYDYYCVPHPWMKGRVIVRCGGATSTISRPGGRSVGRGR